MKCIRSWEQAGDLVSLVAAVVLDVGGVTGSIGGVLCRHGG